MSSPEFCLHVVDAFDDAVLTDALPTRWVRREATLDDATGPLRIAAYDFGLSVGHPMATFLTDRVAAAALESHRARRLILVLDVSGEAPVVARRQYDEWYDAFRTFGLHPDLIVFVSQNISAPRMHANFCRVRGVERRMHVLTYHLWLRYLLREMPAELRDEASFAARQEAYLGARRAGPEHLALCMMHRLRPHRIRMALSLLQSGLWDRCLISFGGLEPERRRVESAEAEGQRATSVMDQFRELDGVEPLLPLLPELEAKGMVSLDFAFEFDRHHRYYHEIVLQLPEALYRSTLFSIVTETEMRDRPIRYTEKSIKPFACYHPFVLFGNPGTLELLRGLGFTTFEGLIDESYDTVTDPSERFAAAFAQVQRLATLPPEAWEAVTGVLIANARHYAFGLEAAFEEQVDRPLVAYLDRLARAEAASAA